ncbi:MAG: DsbA family protein [Solirubrobacterales bacterium]|nr:DsbA family protein [Solirubrobacterales bacterium]
MGNLILLDDRRADRSRPTRDLRPAFFFDLRCPFSYLAAERVERMLGEVDWVPVASSALSHQPAPPRPRERQRARQRSEFLGLWTQAQQRAEQLRLPLVWPDRFPAEVRRAMRAAVYASETGAGARFGLAAIRLAFCGGFDLEDPEILAEAAAAASMTLEDCLAAAGDPARDLSPRATATGLRTRGIRRLPAVRLGTRWFVGEPGLMAASAMLRTAAARRRPLRSDGQRQSGGLGRVEADGGPLTPVA